MVDPTYNPVKVNLEKAPPPPAVESDDPQVIRAQIERTRAQMGYTLDEIQVRLSPEYIKQQTQETIREATIEKVEKMAQTAEYKVNSWRTNAVQTVKDNPIPAALIGVGIGWLLLSDKNNQEEYSTRYYGDGPTRRGIANGGHTNYGRYGEYSAEYDEGPLSQAQSWAADTAEHAQEWVGETSAQAQQKAKNMATTVTEVAQHARENVGETATHAQEYVAETAEQARARARQARRQAEKQARSVKRTFWQTMEENPLAMGVAAAAAGALVGLAFPRTEKENALMGGTRDRMVEEASSTIQESVRKAQTVAEHAVQAGNTEAKREATKQDKPLPSSVSSQERREAQPKTSASA